MREKERLTMDTFAAHITTLLLTERWQKNPWLCLSRSRNILHQKWAISPEVCRDGVAKNCGLSISFLWLKRGGELVIVTGGQRI